MNSRLDRYVAGLYLSCWVLSAVFFLGLFGVVDFFSSIGPLLSHAHDAGNGAAIIGRFYLVQLPMIFKEVAPFVMLMAALLVVLRLQRHNELMAMQLTGRSARRIMLPVFVLTLVFTGGLVWVQEVVAPRVSLEREQLEALLIKGNADWVVNEMHQRDASGRLWSIHNFHVSTGLIEKLNVSGRDAQGRNESVSGSNASWDDSASGWRLQSGLREIRELSSGALIESGPIDVVQTDLRPDDLLMGHREAFDLPYSDVLARSELYPASASYRLLRHYHVTYPLSVLLLVVLGVPFVLRRSARGSLVGLGAALLLCIAYMIVDTTSRNLGTHGFLNPVLAAWLPVILAGSLGVVLFDGLDE
jgi:lipopolysaccharide export LptBFGC system permease protein LptF